MSRKKTEDKLQEQVVVEGVEGTENVEGTEGVEGTEDVVEADNIVYSAVFQMRVHECKAFNLVDGACKFIVESMGGGDLYADTKVINASKETRINSGEKRVFEIAEGQREGAFLYLTSASRPTFRISLSK